MDLSPYVAELQDSLHTAAAVGDETTQRLAAALGGALESSTRLVLMHAMSDLAAEVNRQLSESSPSADPAARRVSVDVRLDGTRVTVGVTRSGSTAAGAETGTAAGAQPGAGADESSPSGGFFSGASTRSFAEAGGDLTRTTVRMFNELKAKAEQAAAEQGVSLNSFISRAVADSIKPDQHRRKGQGRDGWKEAGSKEAGSKEAGKDAGEGEDAGEGHDAPPTDGRYRGWVQG